MSNLSLWHDVPLGDKSPEEFNVIIEIPRGSANKYEVDKETGLIKLDRVSYSAMYYPMDYGFAPQTYWPDKDPLDVLVMTTHPLVPGLLVAVRPIAGIEMIDDGDEDDKIITVPVEDPRFKEFQDLDDLPSHTKDELKHFYETYKELQGKKVVVKSFYGKKTAMTKVKRAVKLYKDKFGG
tara:strand:- start:158 stop:697 length:540 start_codon:yes stop_codon:yes gene_type:complete